MGSAAVGGCVCGRILFVMFRTDGAQGRAAPLCGQACFPSIIRAHTTYQNPSAMTYPPKDVFTMWDRVNEVLSTGQDIWKDDQAICNATIRLRLLRNEIIDVIEATTVAEAVGTKSTARVPAFVASSEGAPIDNDAAKAEAVNAALPIATAIREWAIKTDNDAIALSMDINAADLQNMRDTLTADRLRLIHTTGVSNMGELTRYGVAQPALDDLLGKIRAYEAVNPRSISGGWSALGSEGGDFDEIIRDGMELLDQTLDPAVERLSGTSPGFVDAYKAARSGMETGPSHVPPTLGKL